MKIIEGMKELKLILKKVNKNNELINEYAACPDNERLPFGDKKSQTKEVLSILQANKDLIKNYLKIKQNIDRTNLQTKVEISGVTYTIAELLVLKRTLCQNMIASYKALNDNSARRRISSSMMKTEKAPIIEKFYDEHMKNDGLREWEDLYHNIDSRLEVINATTDLIEQ